MPQLPRKAPSRCPHCGYFQDEPEHLISTYCRGCGSYYKVLSNGAALASYTRQAVQRRIRRRALRVPPREVRCYHCGQVHEVSSHAQTTFCPECNAAIELSDVTVSSRTSRPINTRGNLVVTHSGHISSALTVCHEALISGRVSGMLVCEGVLRLAYSGRLSCQLKAGCILIEKESHVEFSYPIKAHELTVYGQATGNFECTGRIWIDKGGLIEGRIAARSVIVERGGTLLAETFIQRSSEEAGNDDAFLNGEPSLPAY